MTESGEVSKLDEYIRNASQTMNGLLERVFDASQSDVTAEAARYSLMAGGKRIRPILLLLTGDLLEAERESLMPFACAIEMIHTYSLIHDDLPCMDDDTLRRGRPTCHVRYSEATALLAGDALLNGAYELILEQCSRSAPGAMRAGIYIAECAGIKGMIGGQSEDIATNCIHITTDRLYSIHRKKTGALIHASIMVPFVYLYEPGDKEEVRLALESFSGHLGLSFQIKDDLLDASSTSEQMGKTVGKDEADGKATFVTVFGYEEAERLFHAEALETYRALDSLANMGYDTALLVALTQKLHEREK